MAAKKKEDRTLFRQVISTDVMGNRNVEVRAVKAWAQPAKPSVSLTEDSQPHDAMVSAQLEEMKMLSLKSEKEAKLKLFQEEVKRRVRLNSAAKKREAHEKSCKQQKDSEDRLLKTGTIFNDISFNKVFNNHVIQSPDSQKAKPSASVLVEPSSEYTDVANSARHRLSQRQVFTQQYEPLHSADTHHHNVEQMAACHRDILINEHSQHTDGIMRYEEYEGDHDGHRKKSVTFDSDIKLSKLKRDTSQKPPINLDLQKEETEQHRQKIAQVAMCRKVFSDIEREKVKEHHRAREHQLKIARLKEAKELDRLTEEQISAHQTELVNPVSGETETEMVEREQLEHVVLTEAIRVREEKMQKLREMERFMEALKQRLKEKADRCGVDVPPLCCCSDTVWAASPYTCANNCVFYRNPKEFSKALQSLLKSLDLNR